MDKNETPVVASTPPPPPTASAFVPAAPAPARVNKNMDLPNLMLSTTYALNKSNSKRVTVGLEHHGGLYRPVVKLCSTGSPAKYVTLDKNSWELIIDQLDTMIEYVQDSFTFYKDFGKPSKIYLPNHDINFATAYGVKSILIDERPAVPTAKFTRVDLPDAQPLDEESQLVDCSSQFETPCKKKKFECSPGVVMQHATLIGLKNVHLCVDERLKRLEESQGFINRGIDNILEFLKGELNREGDEKAKSILKDCPAFKQFCAMRKNEIENRAKLLMEFSNINKELYDIYLTEFYAFGLSNLAQDLYSYMYSK